MPYNPGSAYPRKTVYSPPTEGNSFQRAVNAPDFSSSASYGSPGMKVFGREKFAAGAAYARGAAGGGDVAAGLQSMQRKGIVGDLQSRYMQQRGLQHGNPGEAADGLRQGTAQDGTPGTQRSSSFQGNPAAVQKQQAAGELTDGLVDNVLTGDMPGETGTANTNKKKNPVGSNKRDPLQGTLFDRNPDNNSAF